MKQYKSVWQQIAKSKTITSTDVFHYCLIRAINSKTESYEEKLLVALYYLHKAFTAVTNKNKLANGWPAYHAVRLASLNVSAHMIKEFQSMVNPLKPWHCLETQSECDLFLQLESDALKQLVETSNDKYIFIFVRQDIEPEQQLVQATHVAEQVTKEMIFQHILELEAENRGLVNKEYLDAMFPTCNHILIGVDNEAEIIYGVMLLLGSYGIQHTHFCEPDLSGSITAVATWPMSRDEKRFLKQYKLLQITPETEGFFLDT